jgi:hypothetical protein
MLVAFGLNLCHLSMGQVIDLIHWATQFYEIFRITKTENLVELLMKNVDEHRLTLIASLTEISYNSKI